MKIVKRLTYDSDVDTRKEKIGVLVCKRANFIPGLAERLDHRFSLDIAHSDIEDVIQAWASQTTTDSEDN